MTAPRWCAERGTRAVNRSSKQPTPNLLPRAGLFVLLLTALQVAVLFPVLPSRLHVHEGDIASQTIRAPRDFTYNSDVLRRAAQDQARRTVPDAFTYDVNVQSDQLAKLADVEGRISAARNDPSLTRPQLIDALANKGVALTPDQSAEIAAFSPAEWQQTENE